MNKASRVRSWLRSRDVTWKILVPWLLLLVGCLAGMWGGWIGENWGFFRDRHLGLMAQRFWQWKVSLNPMNRPEGDVVDYFANFYVYFGPMTSLLLMPVVLVWKSAQSQIVLGLGAMVASLVASYKLAERWGYKEVDRWWWMVFVGVSTPLLAVCAFNLSAYQVQAVGFAIMLVSLVEYYGKRRWWLIGLLIGMAGMTRMSLYLVAVFFGLEWLKSKRKMQSLVMMVIPVVVSVGILGLYNQRRFGSFWESGYAGNVTLKEYPMVANVKHGFFSWEHVPANLYVMLLKAPDPIFAPGGGYVLEYPYLKVDPWGFSLLVGSPLLLLLLRGVNWKKDWTLLVTTAVMAVPVLSYFGIGFSQFGYRYGLDFLPLVIVVLMKNLRGSLGWGAKGLILVGTVFNCVYLMSGLGIYPLLNLYSVEGRGLVGGWW